MTAKKAPAQGKPYTLRKLLSHCLSRKGAVLSPEQLFLYGKAVPLGGQMRDVSEKDYILAEIFGERFGLMLSDLADYGRRRLYEFEGESTDPADVAAQRWLEGDLSDLNIKTGHGKHSAPHPVSGIRRTFGQCLAQLVAEAQDKDLSKDSLWWLSQYQDYSLDWLLFGEGTLAKSTFHAANDPVLAALEQAVELNGGALQEARAELDFCPTVSDIKAIRGTTTWRGADWNWLMNGKTHTAFKCRSPTLPLCARCVSSWNIQPVMPEMPDLLAFVDWLYVYILREFFVVEPLARGDWRQRLFTLIARGKNKVLILLGTTPQAGTQYRLGKATPGSGVVKLAYFIQLIIKRYGRQGFLQYLSMVNDEARARGFRDLLDVAERRSWYDTRSACAGMEDGGDADAAEDMDDGGMDAFTSALGAGNFAAASGDMATDGGQAGDGGEAGAREDAGPARANNSPRAKARPAPGAAGEPGESGGAAKARPAKGRKAAKAGAKGAEAPGGPGAEAAEGAKDPAPSRPAGTSRRPGPSKAAAEEEDRPDAKAGSGGKPAGQARKKRAASPRQADGQTPGKAPDQDDAGIPAHVQTVPPAPRKRRPSPASGFLKRRARAQD